MGRKVLLSFLGTGAYKECKYKLSDSRVSEVVTYVQDAIFQLACKDFIGQDRVYVLLTEEAERKHWNALKESLNSEIVIPVQNIPDGSTSEEIWQIFEIAINLFEDGDEVILDITHGFRSLPMLGIVLLDYAKVVKNISVLAIYYGAFEQLGPAYNIEDRIPDPKDRVAPLIDLISFSLLQAWTAGAHTFIETGNPKLIHGLGLMNIRPILRYSQRDDEVASKVKVVLDSLRNGEAEIATNRGALINKGSEFEKAINQIHSLFKKESEIFQPLEPLLEIIETKIKKFSRPNKWSAAVEWCIEHNLIQQGITQFQEGIISDLCKIVSLQIDNLVHREIVSQTFFIQIRSIEEDSWKEPASSSVEHVKRILAVPMMRELSKLFDSLSQLRNDVNHGGYISSAIKKPEKIVNKLSILYNTYSEISKRFIDDERNKYLSGTESRMTLLNLSNHPSTNWSEKQKKTALEKYGSVEDLSFPNIDPSWDRHEVEQLVDEYIVKVREIDPKAVHIMGELVFTHLFVTKLSDLGIPCIASTTERIVEMEGDVKKIKFEFVMFRSY